MGPTGAMACPDVSRNRPTEGWMGTDIRRRIFSADDRIGDASRLECRRSPHVPGWSEEGVSQPLATPPLAARFALKKGLAKHRRPAFLRLISRLQSCAEIPVECFCFRFVVACSKEDQMLLSRRVVQTLLAAILLSSFLSCGSAHSGD